MKKNFNIFIVLIVAILLTVFSVAFYKRKTKKNALAKVNRNKLESIETQKQSAPQKMVFYSNVGSSSPRNSDGSSENQRKIVSRYTIEIAQFATQSEAENLLVQLKNKGIDGFYTPVRRGPEVIYKVRLGIFSNPEDAQQSLGKVIAKSQIKGSVAKLQ